MCEAALEDLIHMIDGRKRIGAIYKCLVRICDTRHKNKLAGGLTEDELREGYQRVRKVVERNGEEKINWRWTDRIHPDSHNLHRSRDADGQ